MSFSAQIRAFCNKTNTSIDDAVKLATVLAVQQLVMRSPVADPDLWAANAGAAAARESAFAGGKSARAAKKAHPNKAGKRHIGGRFRANWQVGLHQQPDATITDATDAGGGKTISRLTAVAAAARAGGVIYISNSLPYADALERGHSKQAPAGIVRLTVLALPVALESALRARRQ